MSSTHTLGDELSEALRHTTDAAAWAVTPEGRRMLASDPELFRQGAVRFADDGVEVMGLPLLTLPDGAERPWRVLSKDEVAEMNRAAFERERWPRIQALIAGAKDTYELARALNFLRVGERTCIRARALVNIGFNWVFYRNREEALRADLVGSAYGAWPMWRAPNGDLHIERRREGKRVFDRDGRPVA